MCKVQGLRVSRVYCLLRSCVVSPVEDGCTDPNAVAPQGMSAMRCWSHPQFQLGQKLPKRILPFGFGSYRVATLLHILTRPMVLVG